MRPLRNNVCRSIGSNGLFEVVGLSRGSCKPCEGESLVHWWRSCRSIVKELQVIGGGVVGHRWRSCRSLAEELQVVRRACVVALFVVGRECARAPRES